MKPSGSTNYVSFEHLKCSESDMEKDNIHLRRPKTGASWDQKKLKSSEKASLRAMQHDTGKPAGCVQQSETFPSVFQKLP